MVKLNIKVSASTRIIKEDIKKMKRFMAVLLAIVLSLSVFAVLTGCGEGGGEPKGDLAFSEVVNNINLQEGITVSTQGEITVEGQTGSFDGLMKYLNGTGDFKMDFVLKSDFGEEFDVEAYVRNNDIYVSFDTDEGRKYLKENFKEETGMDMSQLYPTSLSDYESYFNILDSEVLFFKNGNGYKAEYDLTELATRVLTKAEGVIDMLSVDTTFKQIYDKIEGDKLLNKVFGTKKGREYYAEFLQEIKNLPEGTIPQEYEGFIKSLPTDVDAFISMLKSVASMIDGTNPDGGVTVYGTFIKNLINNLPEMGDKTMAEYVKEVVKGYFDMTVFDFVVTLSGVGDELPKEAIAEMKEQLGTQLNMIKGMIKPKISQIKAALASSKCKFDFTANAEGQLTGVACDISVTEELVSIFSGEMGGVNGYAADTATSPVAFALKGSVNVQSGATDFVDVSKLELYEFDEPVDLDALIESVEMEAIAALDSDTDHSLYGETEYGWKVYAIVGYDGEIYQLEITAVTDAASLPDVYEEMIRVGALTDFKAYESEDGSGYIVNGFILTEYFTME